MCTHKNRGVSFVLVCTPVHGTFPEVWRCSPEGTCCSLPSAQPCFLLSCQDSAPAQRKIHSPVCSNYTPTVPSLDMIYFFRVCLFVGLFPPLPY